MTSEIGGAGGKPALVLKMYMTECTVRPWSRRVEEEEKPRRRGPRPVTEPGARYRWCPQIDCHLTGVDDDHDHSAHLHFKVTDGPAPDLINELWQGYLFRREEIGPRTKTRRPRVTVYIEFEEDDAEADPDPTEQG